MSDPLFVGVAYPLDLLHAFLEILSALFLEQFRHTALIGAYFGYGLLISASFYHSAEMGNGHKLTYENS